MTVLAQPSMVPIAAASKASCGYPTLDRPIIIIGAPRSGTTVLGKMLGLHADLAYLEEPRLIWRFGNDSRSDMFLPQHARPEVCQYIRSAFERHVRASGRKRLLEKSPSNALRIGFVNRVLPSARFIHIIRHGVDSVLSIREYTQRHSGGVVNAKMLSRLHRRLHEMRLSQIPHYAMEFMRRLLPGKIAGPRAWGPRIAAHETLARELGPLALACLQWRQCVETACHEGRALGPGRYMEIRVEAIGIDTMRDVLRFCDLPDDPTVEAFIAQHFKADLPGARRAKAKPEELDEILRWIESTLKWLEYSV